MIIQLFTVRNYTWRIFKLGHFILNERSTRGIVLLYQTAFNCVANLQQNLWSHVKILDWKFSFSISRLTINESLNFISTDRERLWQAISLSLTYRKNCANGNCYLNEYGNGKYKWKMIKELQINNEQQNANETLLR